MAATRRAGQQKTILWDRERRKQEAANTAALRDFAALYGIHEEEQATLKDIDRIARDHERLSQSHGAVAGFLRELIAATHEKTLRPPRSTPEGA
jgi:hypothetical protein